MGILYEELNKHLILFISYTDVIVCTNILYLSARTQDFLCSMGILLLGKLVKYIDFIIIIVFINQL